MIKYTSKILFSLIALLIVSCINNRPDDYTVNTLDILFIGNSLTHSNGGIDKQLTKMFDSTNTPLKIRSMRIAPGGERLSGHYRKGDAVVQIRSVNWDIVVLQEYSNTPIIDRENFFRYSRIFHRLIKGTNAATLFFLTWEYKDNPDMTSILTASYTAISDELESKVVPVGIAWKRVRQERPDLELYSDFKHPNKVGTYLTTCVFYSFLTKMNARESSYTMGLDTATANYIRDIAYNTVQQWSKRYE